MPTTFTAASGEVFAVLNEVMDEAHTHLRDAGVKVGILMASNDTGVAIKHAGYPAAAQIKVVPLADRVSKGYDAEIRIDDDEWADAKPARRKALIDHELCHLGLVRDEYGKVQTDDLDRPKLRLRKGDFYAGDGFQDVIIRHGEMAYEHTNSLRVQAAVKGAMSKRRGLFDDVESK